MARHFNYQKKFDSYTERTLYAKLPAAEQAFIRDLAFVYRFTFQEFREVVLAARDLWMWGETELSVWLQRGSAASAHTGSKAALLRGLRRHLEELRRRPKVYPERGLPGLKSRQKRPVTLERSDKKIHGMCPVASEQTVCCNLHTIDAVENCAFGCSYCTIQTFYSERFAFDAGFAEKLHSIRLEPDRLYHFGTGQSSDSLVWGNRHGILDALCAFAAQHPNVLLEFKTKSNNVRYFLEHAVPQNIVCSWSLNTPTIIQNEERFTATLEERLEAARAVADVGVKVAFHFHPMVYYAGWRSAYAELAALVMDRFVPAEVAFISFGSVTLIKPAIKQIRESGQPTKILQMEMVPDPHGKLTYPDEVKIRMFRHMYGTFSPWLGRVFFYLCMEKAAIWRASLGYVYTSNEEFERDFLTRVSEKLPLRSIRRPALAPV